MLQKAFSFWGLQPCICSLAPSSIWRWSVCSQRSKWRKALQWISTPTGENSYSCLSNSSECCHQEAESYSLSSEVKQWQHLECKLAAKSGTNLEIVFWNELVAWAHVFVRDKDEKQWCKYFTKQSQGNIKIFSEVCIFGFGADSTRVGSDTTGFLYMQGGLAVPKPSCLYGYVHIPHIEPAMKWGLAEWLWS